MAKWLTNFELKNKNDRQMLCSERAKLTCNQRQRHFKVIAIESERKRARVQRICTNAIYSTQAEHRQKGLQNKT